MKILFVSALLALLACQQASAEMPRPKVVVRAAIAERIDDEFENDQERQRFIRHLEDKVATEARKLPCLDWQASASVSGPPPQAEFWVRLVENGSQILLSYGGNYEKPLPAGVDRKALAKALQPLPRSFNRPLLTGYAGYLDVLEAKFDEVVKNQFGEESFEVEFNKHFVNKVVIAEGLDFDQKHLAVIVPVAAERMSLEPGADLSVLLKRAPVCGDVKDCTVPLKSEGPWYHEKWPGALRCSFPSGKADCCDPLTWSDLTSATAGAGRRAVLLGQHKHCSFCWTPDGLYRHPEAP